MARKVESFSIANGASLSDEIAILGDVVAIIMPSAWTAANLTFQAGSDDTAVANMYDEFGNEYTVTAAASRYIFVDPADFAGVAKLKVRSGTSGSAVNQGAARTVKVVTLT